MATGLSGRAYARSRNISEAAVRKYLRSGVLASAVMEDGSIDPIKADAALKAARTRGKSVPVPLQAARSRRERALALRDTHELAKIRRLHTRADEYAEDVADLNGVLVTVFRRLPSRLTPRVVGQTARTINTTIKDAVNDLLGEAHEALQRRMAERERELALEPVPESERTPDLDSMTPTELAAYRATTQAETHERSLAIELGILRRSDDLLMIVAENQSVMKSRLLAIAGRLSTQLEHADRNRAEKLLSDEIEEIVALLDEPVERIRAMQPREAA